MNGSGPSEAERLEGENGLDVLEVSYLVAVDLDAEASRTGTSGRAQRTAREAVDALHPDAQDSWATVERVIASPDGTRPVAVHVRVVVQR